MTIVKKALAIGIDNYSMAPLHGCVNDATSFADIIKANGDGSPNFDVQLEINVQTKAELRKKINALFSGDCETVLFYFSGHGFFNEFGGYIVTPDYQSYDEGITMHEILTLANNSKSKDKIIILDSCHSGSIGSQISGGGTDQINEGISILTSSRGGEASVEVNGHGVFTNLLLDALSGGAADLRGHISPGGIYAYIDQALGPWEQRPVFKTNVTRFTSLRTVVPQVPTVIIRRITEYFTSPDMEYTLDPSFEDTNTEQVNHSIIKPYADQKNVAAFKNLQKLQSVGLVVPVNADYMYFAAMESKSCKLTPLGHHYWRLVKDRRI